MRLIALVFVLIQLSGCGNRFPTHSDFSGNKRAPLIISMSGFATCRASESHHQGKPGPMGTEFFKRSVAVSDDIKNKTGVTPDIFASCYDIDKNVIASSTLHPEKADLYDDAGYLQLVRSAMQAYSEVYIVGHSYGGWLAMKLVEGWEGPAEKIKLLYTIDPISKQLCFFNNPDQCLSAPKDILAIGRQHIKDVTEVWVNPWQNTTFFLHSSIIPQADENPQFEAEHYEIDAVAAIWDSLKSKITN